VKFCNENIFVVLLIFTKQTNAKFTSNEIMQKNFVAKFHISIKEYSLCNFIIDCMYVLLTVSCLKSVDPPKSFSLPCMQHDLRFGGPCASKFQKLFDVETRLLVQKNFIFSNTAKLQIDYVKVRKYQGLLRIVDPALVTILNSKILSEV